MSEDTRAKLEPLTTTFLVASSVNWKDASVGAAAARIAAQRTRRPGAARGSGDHIDDPLRDHDDFFRDFALERPLDPLELKHRRLDVGHARVARDGHVGAFAAVHLD